MSKSIIAESNGQSGVKEETELLNVPCAKTAQLLAPDHSSLASRTTNDNASLTGPSSDAGSSSYFEIDECGDAKQLQQTTVIRRPAPNDNVDQLVVHTGPSYPTLISDATGSDFKTLVGDEEDESPHDLDNVIREAFQTSSSNGVGQKFLPFDKLSLLITHKTVYRELRRNLKVKTDKEVDDLARQICEPAMVEASPSRSGSDTARKKIFAILVMIEGVDTIVDFIKEGLWDSFLPFHFNNKSNRVYRKLKQVNNQPEKEIPIQCFSNKRVLFRENFQDYQWTLLSPYFVIPSSDDESEPLHYNLDSKIILPFVEDHAAETTPSYSGGFGEVWRVKFHNAHLSEQFSENKYFAIKRLRKSDPALFEREVLALERVNTRGQHHMHLIKLHFTFSYREQYHFVFPWADGNLKDYWQRFPEPKTTRRDHSFVLWIAEQWLGIAKGLLVIHNCSTDADSEDDENNSSAAKTRGRHGDIKPENILWFAPHPASGDSHCQGTLVISDFGLTQFNRTVSASMVSPKHLPISPTYRSPEYDICYAISQKYDIWTLGCVMLEFLVWYIQGYREWDEFSKTRVREDNQVVLEDTYFKIVRIPNEHRDDHDKGAIIKKCVVEKCEDLRQDRLMTPFLADLLEFIETKLLRMRQAKRANCDEVVTNLEKLRERCNNKDYCTEFVPKQPRRADTALSYLVAVPLSFSPAMEKRLDTTNANAPIHDGDVDGRTLRVRFHDDASFAEPTRVIDSDGIRQSSEIYLKETNEAETEAAYSQIILKDKSHSEDDSLSSIHRSHGSASEYYQQPSGSTGQPETQPDSTHAHLVWRNDSLKNQRPRSQRRRDVFLKAMFSCFAKSA